MSIARDLRLLCAGALVAIIFAAAPAQAANLDASGFGSIQEAIDAASPGDTVFVGPGSYAGNLVLQPGVNLRGAGGTSSVIIGPGNPGWGLRVSGDSTVSGFYFIGGYFSVHITGGSPVVRDNRFEGNRGGQAIFAQNASPTVIRNHIGRPVFWDIGQGINFRNSTGLIANNQVFGALYPLKCDGGAAPLIRDNVFSGPGRGWGMTLNNASPIMVNNVIAHYQIAFDIWNDSFPVIVNNTVVGNLYSFYWGGGSAPTVHNNIFAWNGDEPHCTTRWEPATASHNLFVGPADAGCLGGSDNVFGDPGFVDRGGRDYRLTAGSPAIDAGYDDAAEFPDTDFDGNARRYDGLGDGNRRVDMGAFEFGSIPNLCDEGDQDEDDICTEEDNCPSVANPAQEDGDGDGAGDVCDPCPLDPQNDADGDGLCGNVDRCPYENPNGLDADGDGCIDTPETLAAAVLAELGDSPDAGPLLASLDAAAAAYARGNDKAGDNAMEAFINKLEAKRGGRLSGSTIALLTAMAHNVIDAG